jgi:hypothetical protein
MRQYKISDLWGETRQNSVRSLKTEVLFRIASNDCVSKRIVILTRWLSIRYLNTLRWVSEDNEDVAVNDWSS